MTLTEAKKKYGIDEVSLRLIINTDLKRDKDYFMENEGRRWVLHFTKRGERMLFNLISRRKKEYIC